MSCTCVARACERCAVRCARLDLFWSRATGACYLRVYRGVAHRLARRPARRRERENHTQEPHARRRPHAPGRRRMWRGGRGGGGHARDAHGRRAQPQGSGHERDRERGRGRGGALSSSDKSTPPSRVPRVHSTHGHRESHSWNAHIPVPRASICESRSLWDQRSGATLLGQTAR